MQKMTTQSFQLSPQQRRIWFLERGAPGPAYRCRAALRISGKADVRALALVLAETAAHREILRTAFPRLVGLKLPVQSLGSSNGSIPVPEVDLSALAAGCRESAAEMVYAAHLPFALERGEVLHACWLSLGDGGELILDLSSMCADPVTVELLSEGVLNAYAHRGLPSAEVEPEPELQYADVAKWQNELLESPETAEGVQYWVDFWRDREIAAQLAWRLPFEKENTVGVPFAPQAVAIPFPPPRAEALDALAAAWDAKSSDLLLACWQILLARSSGNRDVLVGVLHSCRKYEELAGVLGPLARYLPVHVKFDPDARLREILASAREAVVDADRRQENFSWELAAGWTGGADEPGFFSACFEDLEASSNLSRRTALVDRFKLALSCSREKGELRLELRYDPVLFERKAAIHIADRFGTLLRSLAERPESRYTDLDLLGPDELEMVLCEFSSSVSSGPKSPAATLHGRFAVQAERNPEREALVGNGLRFTYRELNESANRLAHHLQSLGVGPEVPVALLLERSPQAVVALLAILKAGGAYVPLDPRQPVERLALILADAGARVVVTERRLAVSLPTVLGALPAVELDAPSTAAAIASRPHGNPPCPELPEGLAYTIFTSGSTGRPKGVLVAHRSPLCLLAGLEEAVFGGCPERPLRASLNAPLFFDASVQQLVLLLAGHTLHVVPEVIRADGPALCAFLRDERLDVFDCTPSQLRVLLAAGLLAGDEPVPALVLVAGEAVDDALWKEVGRAPRTAFFNIYGPTECTVDATVQRIEEGQGGPTIGRPLSGYEAFLLDPNLRPVAIGAPGEICLGGAGLARGYAGRPDATAEKFVPHPFGGLAGERLYRSGDLARHRTDGRIEFLGRLDQQVKIRGFRIEPGEIEAVLREHPWVREAAVVARQTEPTNILLVAHVVLVAAAPPGEAGVREALYRHLGQRIPAYMMPAAVIVHQAFPRLPNGKLDRAALPEPQQFQGESAGYVAPRNPVEEILCDIWAELLRRDRVGIDDDFFEIGGHSLLATQVIARVRHVFAVEIKVRTLFETPTVAGLAAGVAAAQRDGLGSVTPPLIRVPRTENLPLSYSQQRLWLHHQIEPGSAAYNLPIAVRLAGALAPRALADSLTALVRRHETLRTTFEVSGGPEREPVQRISAASGVRLPEIDLSSLGSRVEAEAHRLLAAEGGQPFDLACGPLLRAALLRLRTDEHVVALTMHHIVSDAWSMGLLVRELVVLYGAYRDGLPAALPKLPVQYGDFAHWQRSWLRDEVLEEQLAYWHDRLAGAPALIGLRTDRPRPAIRSFRGGSLDFALGRALSDRLRALSREEGCTLFMTLLAVFQVLLRHWSGEDDIVVGAPLSYRNWTAIEGLIGFFVNTLPFRADLSGNPTFRELLVRSRKTVLDAFAHEHVSFEMLAGELRLKRSLGYSALFQVGFTFQAAEVQDGPEIAGLSVSPFKVEVERAHFDLNLSIIDTPRLVGSMEYSRDLFDEPTIAAMREHLECLLEEVARDPEVRLGHFDSVLAEKDRLRWGSLAYDLEKANEQSFRNRRRQPVVARAQSS